MKNSKIFRVFSLLFSFPLLLSAATNISLGRDGESYLVNGVPWQNIHMEESSFRLTAAIPGSPRSGIYGAALKSSSVYNETAYWVQTSINDQGKPPKDQKALASLIKKEPDLTHTKLTPIPCDKPFIAFAARFTYKNKAGDKGITHIYVSKHKMYIMGVVGKDHSLANQFFDTLKIDREENI